MKKLTLTQGKLMVWEMPDFSKYVGTRTQGWKTRAIERAKARGVEVVNGSDFECTLAKDEMFLMFLLAANIKLKEGDTIDLPDGQDIEYGFQYHHASMRFYHDPDWIDCNEEQYKSLQSIGDIYTRKIARIIQKPVEKYESNSDWIATPKESKTLQDKLKSIGDKIKKPVESNIGQCPTSFPCDCTNKCAVIESMKPLPDSSESQEAMLDEIIESYDDWHWRFGGGAGDKKYKAFMKLQLEKFTITRRKP